MLKIRIENSQSRSKKHAYRALALIVSNDGVVYEPRIVRSEQAKPMYAKGVAQYIYVEFKESELLVYLRFVKNLRNEVKGYIEVLSSSGEKLLQVKYVDGKVRCVRGKRGYWKAIENVLTHLRIPYARVNLKTGICFERGHHSGLYSSD